MPAWSLEQVGVVTLPSGRLVRARALRRPLPDTAPDFGLYLSARRPREAPWPCRWLRWPDFALPTDPADAADALAEAWQLCAHQRVEIACAGGRGRTGTALACLAVLDGVPPHRAVAWVRHHYDRRAVETPWQRRFVKSFPPQ